MKDGYLSRWEANLRAAGHDPVMRDGKLDEHAMDLSLDGGPMCKACGQGWSYVFDVDQLDGKRLIEPCDGGFE